MVSGADRAETMTVPRVSICIPTYNRADMVGCAIASALAQTYQDIEVVVVDNASTDNIEEVVASFDDPRLRFVKNEENLGLFGNFNRCIEVARGEFLHILHSDDYIDPDFTETCVAFFYEHPNVALTSTSARLQLLNKTIQFTWAEKNTILPAPEGFRTLLRERSFINCPSVMVRRELYKEMGSFSLEFPYSSDYYQWLRIGLKFDVAYIRNVYVNYRQGEHSESYRLLFTTPSGYLDTLKIYIQMIADLNEDYPLFVNDLNVALRRFMKDCFFAGFTRAERMKGFHPSLFSGIALSAWSLNRPSSLYDMIVKTTDLLVISIAGICLQIPLTRRAIKRLIERRDELY